MLKVSQNILIPKKLRGLTKADLVHEAIVEQSQQTPVYHFKMIIFLSAKTSALL